MNYQYFKFVTDLADLKSQYRNLCKQHHPDLGGDVEIMKQVNVEYDARLKSGFFNAEFEEKNTSADIESALRDVIEKTCIFKNISIEICGRWIWFTGETWRYKKLLKDIGCQWAAKKTAWYWKPSDDKGKHRGNYTLDQIRTKYGSSTVKMKDQTSLA